MKKLENSNVVICYDGTLEGFLTAVFQSYAMHIVPADICEASLVQPAFGQELLDVCCDMSLAERVKVGICNKAGYTTFNRVKLAFLSCEEKREMQLFQYIAACMEYGRKGINNPSDPVVWAVESLEGRVLKEQEKIFQFARFELMENGVYLAVVNPRANLVPLVMPHFAARFNTQPFAIYDEVHHIAGVYDLQKTYLVQTDSIEKGPFSGSEGDFQQLWKTFYDSVANEQRHNPDLRTSNMPKRYWRNLTEMKLAVPQGAA